MSATGKNVHKLTKGETRVLNMLGRGYSVEQIMANLGVCRRAVENHRRNAMEKFLAKDFEELKRMAIERGI